MIRIPNPDEYIIKSFVDPTTVELIGKVSQEQIDEIKSNQLKIATLGLKVLRKERKEIRAFRRQNK